MQRGGNNATEEYDLEGVTAKLALMEARRRRCKDRQSTGAEQQQQLDRKPTCGFDLAPAELSSDSDGGSNDSDDDCRSTSTNSLPSDDESSRRSESRARSQKLRVVDSLDLSMSVCMVGGDPHQADSASNSSMSVRSSRLKYPGEKHDTEISDEQPGKGTICKTSRIPKLVERRRQMQTVGKRAGKLVNAQDTSSVVMNHYKGLDKLSSLSGGGGGSGTRECSDRAKVRHAAQTIATETNQITFGVESRGKHALSNTHSILDDIAATTAEERQLLQSLEMLNQRLTNASAPAVVVLESGPQANRRELQFSKSKPLVSESSSSVHLVQKEVDNENLRAAAYGGGTHRKPRQPSSASLRSSSVKRAELSEGIHKARVRVGGAIIHDSPIDGSGKHKILVKKDLAHLLF